MFRRLGRSGLRSPGATGWRSAAAGWRRPDDLKVRELVLEEAKSHYLEFLWVVMERLECKVNAYAYRALGDTARFFMSEMTAQGRKVLDLSSEKRFSYVDIISRISRKPFAYDYCGEDISPDLELIDLVQDKLHMRQASPEELEPAHDFCRKLACRAEKSLFCGEPNMEHLQKLARLFAANCGPDFMDLWDRSLCLTRIVDATCVMFADDIRVIRPYRGPYEDYVHKSIVDGMKQAQMIADEGGLQEFADHGGLVDLYNFELKHAHQLLQSYLRNYKEGYDKRELVSSSYETDRYHTIDVQVPGITSSDQVSVTKCREGLLVSTKDDIFRSRKFAVPDHVDIDHANPCLKDGILTIRLPKRSGLSLLNKKLDDVTKVKDLDNKLQQDLVTKLKQSKFLSWVMPAVLKEKPLAVTTRKDKGYYILEASVPGLTREQLNVKYQEGGKCLTIQARNESLDFHVPDNANLEQTEVYLEHGVMTIRIQLNSPLQPIQVESGLIPKPDFEQNEDLLIFS